MTWNSTRVEGEQCQRRRDPDSEQTLPWTFYYLQLTMTGDNSEDWWKLTRRGAQNWRMVISKVAIAITSTIPFLPAISEDFVFDDLPAIAKNNDLVTASPMPIFWVCRGKSLHRFWMNITSLFSARFLGIKPFLVNKPQIISASDNFFILDSGAFRYILVITGYNYTLFRLKGTRCHLPWIWR